MQKSAKRERPPSFKVEMPGDNAFKKLFLDKMNEIREILVRRLQRAVNNGDILTLALDNWVQRNGGCKKKTLPVSTAVPLSETNGPGYLPHVLLIITQTVGDFTGSHQLL